MSDAAPPPQDTTRFELDMAKHEVEQLWRVMMGNEPMPDRPDRALRRLQGLALHVEWPHTVKRRTLPLGLVIVE